MNLTPSLHPAAACAAAQPVQSAPLKATIAAMMDRMASAARLPGETFEQAFARLLKDDRTMQAVYGRYRAAQAVSRR